MSSDHLSAMPAFGRSVQLCLKLPFQISQNNKFKYFVKTHTSAGAGAWGCVHIRRDLKMFYTFYSHRKTAIPWEGRTVERALRAANATAHIWTRKVLSHFFLTKYTFFLNTSEEVLPLCPVNHLLLEQTNEVFTSFPHHSFLASSS